MTAIHATTWDNAIRMASLSQGGAGYGNLDATLLSSPHSRGEREWWAGPHARGFGCITSLDYYLEDEKTGPASFWSSPVSVSKETRTQVFQ